MTVESASHIDELVPSNTAAATPWSEGDDHISLIKTVLKTDFASLSGAVSANEAQLGTISGQTSNVSTQFSALLSAITANSTAISSYESTASAASTTISTASSTLVTQASSISVVSTAAADAAPSVEILATIDLTGHGSQQINMTTLSGADAVWIRGDSVGILGALNEMNIDLRLSDDGGSTWEQDAGDYVFAGMQKATDAGGNDGTEEFKDVDSNNTYFPILTDGKNVQSGELASFDIVIIGLTRSRQFCFTSCSAIYNDGGGNEWSHSTYIGECNVTSPDGIQIFNRGTVSANENFNEGTITLIKLA